MNHGFQLERKDANYGKKFYGKYRAIVTNNKDSDPTTGRMGRIKVKCPKVLGEDESTWCTPCLPFAGPSKGTLFMPKVGDTVWVEFEEGDPDKPIWVGNWWGTGERPAPINGSYVSGEEGLHHVIETDKVKIHFDDKNDRLTITVNGSKPVSITLDAKSGVITHKASQGNVTSIGTISTQVVP